MELGSRFFRSLSRRSLIGDLYITDTFQEIYTEDDEEIEFTIFGYTNSKKNTILYHLIAIVFLGFPYILYYLFPSLRILQYRKCILDEATVLLISDHYGNFSIEHIKAQQLQISAIRAKQIRYFYFYFTKYVWFEENRLFESIPKLEPILTFNDYLKDKRGLSHTDQRFRSELYGPNIINVEKGRHLDTFIEEIVNPFNLFQAGLLILWVIDGYFIYSGFVFLFTLISSIVSLIQTAQHRKTIFDMVESSKANEVIVVRENIFIEPTLCRRNPKDLVPGDLIILPAADYKMPCDAVLLTGQCIMNESILTGESVPKTKTALPTGDDVYDINVHVRHTLFAGTYLVRSRVHEHKDVLARVIKTGYYTTKGTLVKNILFQEEEGLTFNKDVFAFVMIMLFLASFGTIYTLYIYISRRYDIMDTLIRSCDCIVYTSPPALPATMTVGSVYSQSRLEKKGIYCASPHKIKTCGKIEIACFDKTGTLTYDALRLNCVVPIVDERFSKPLKYIWQFRGGTESILEAMGTCHALAIVDGKVIGDPLDLTIFEFTRWEMEDKQGQPTVQPYQFTVTDHGVLENFKVGIIRQFFFASSVQCMSVITQQSRKSYMVIYTKGAPEKVKSICLPNTIPADFQALLAQYTIQGNKVIAVGCKRLPASFRRADALKVDRESVEHDLKFLGFIVLKNTLKPESATVINTLEDVNIITMMVTGDNILTAISVGYDCGMIKPDQEIFLIGNKIFRGYVPEIIVQKGVTTGNFEKLTSKYDDNAYHFAIDGETWNILVNFYYSLLPQLLTRIKIFARFRPEQKNHLIIELQNLNFIVSMVGDGANDCRALKTADIGVSFSKAQVSVTAAFTSEVEDISCILDLIREGRCATVTGESTFKYMACYGLLVFSCIGLLIREHIVLSTNQCLYIDLGIMTGFGLTFSSQGPSKKLTTKRPVGSLVVARSLVPMLLHIFACIFIEWLALHYLHHQPWFESLPDETDEPISGTWVAMVLYPLLTHQIVIMGVVYAKSSPFREMVIRNYRFMAIVIVCSAINVYLTICPHNEVVLFMDMVDISHETAEQKLFRYKMLIFPVISLIVAYAIELCIAEREWFERLIKYCSSTSNPEVLEETPSWKERIGAHPSEGSILTIF